MLRSLFLLDPSRWLDRDIEPRFPSSSSGKSRYLDWGPEFNFIHHFNGGWTEKVGLFYEHEKTFFQCIKRFSFLEQYPINWDLVDVWKEGSFGAKRIGEIVPMKSMLTQRSKMNKFQEFFWLEIESRLCLLQSLFVITVSEWWHYPTVSSGVDIIKVKEDTTRKKERVLERTINKATDIQNIVMASKIWVVWRWNKLSIY